MTEDQGRVIRFPAWRRTVDGAPGVRQDPRTGTDTRAPVTGDAMAGWRPERSSAAEIDGLDRPVWHEGDSRSGEVLIRLRADILRLRPPVWRRLECLGSLTLDRMHPVLAAAFGWDRDQEYRFRDVVRESTTRVGTSFGNAFTPTHGIHEADVRLDDVLGAPRERLRYSYRLRGGFELTIVAEDVMPVPPAGAGGVTPAARVLAGRRNDPPASVYGPALYELSLSGIARGQIAADLGLRLPDGFDPAAFDLDLVDRRVRAAADA